MRNGTNITAMNGAGMHLSIVVPLFNEEESVGPLLERLQEVCSSFTFNWEVILVDDGSTDRTWAMIEKCKPAMGWAASYQVAKKLWSDWGNGGRIRSLSRKIYCYS